MYESGFWHSSSNANEGGGQYFSDLSSFTAAADSRHLSITTNSNDTSFYAWLVFEPMNQTVSILRGSFMPLSPLHNETSDFPKWKWENISSELQSITRRSGLRLGAPFTAWGGTTIFAGKYMNGSYSEQAVFPDLYDPSYSYESNLGQSEISSLDHDAIADIQS